MIKHWKTATPLIALLAVIAVLTFYSDTEKPKPDSLTIGGITKEFNASQVKDEYTMERAAFVKSDEKISVEIGDKKSDSFKQILKLRSANKELISEVLGLGSGDLSFEGDKIIYGDGKIELNFYEIPSQEAQNKNQITPTGIYAYEQEIILKTNPSNNVVEVAIDSGDLSVRKNGDGTFEFYEQISLPEGMPDEEKEGINTDVVRFRIDPIVVKDSKGTEAKIETAFENGVLTITIPQDFLEKAVYPVIIDPSYTIDSGSATTLATSYSNQRRLV